MSALGMYKQAIALWTHIPGTPFTLSNPIAPTERLPGTTEWAPQDMISRIGRGMQARSDPQELATQERNHGLGANLAAGTAAGAVGGGLLGRLATGESATKPFKEVLQKGLSMRGLRNLSRVPMAAKALTLGGATAGLFGAGARWRAGADDRERTAYSVMRGLMREGQDRYNARLQTSVLQQQLENRRIEDVPRVALSGKL